MEILQPHIGDRVRVRQRTWLVQNVEPHDRCQLLTLTGVSGSDPQRTQRVLQPFDDVEAVIGPRGPTRVGIRAWRRACRSVLLDDGPSWALRSAVSAGIDLLTFQFEPALALLRGLGSRLLIADDVGLGKTVQAMLAIAELRLRGVISRVLVICPAGLREQWADECASRFALPLTILDQTGLRRARSMLPAGVNPWTTQPLAVASIDFVKRAEILPSVLEAHWDAIVVDEAHGVCGRSDRHHAVSSLCRRAPYVVLLSATPHNGDEAAFAALCALGRHDDALVVFRRSRLEAGRDAGRRTHTVRVSASDAERRMHAALAAFTRAVRRESASMDGSVWLMLSLLHKRALSSPFALAASAERRLQLLGEPCPPSEAQLAFPWDEDGGELESADSAPMWSVPALKDERRERQLLQDVAGAARLAQADESKLRALHRLLRRVREPVIVFTEYRDTLLHVRSRVAPHASVVHGGLSRDQRRVALQAFARGGVLLATDAAGEGLNLHQHCRCVINLELPWNPMKLEQRTGRVDRIGQQRRVHVFHLVADGDESRLLNRLSERVAQAQARIDAPDPLRGRAAWTEDASARLVILREEPRQQASPAWDTIAVPLTRLRDEAGAEARRLAIGRAVARPRSSTRPPPNAPASLASSVLIARSRRRRARAALRGRVLVVLRSAVVD
ncbi:MAG TPA: helicase-related protein, partial [Vicinamibacterales bacterium]|nr:helicase-related protein [Vicinamibacterales bacterium]